MLPLTGQRTASCSRYQGHPCGLAVFFFSFFSLLPYLALNELEVYSPTRLIILQPKHTIPSLFVLTRHHSLIVPYRPLIRSTGKDSHLSYSRQGYGHASLGKGREIDSQRTMGIRNFPIQSRKKVAAGGGRQETRRNGYKACTARRTAHCGGPRQVEADREIKKLLDRDTQCKVPGCFDFSIILCCVSSWVFFDQVSRVTLKRVQEERFEGHWAVMMQDKAWLQ